jgi:hypothetical protein
VGASSRAIINALIAHETDRNRLADLTRGRLKGDARGFAGRAPSSVKRRRLCSSPNRQKMPTFDTDATQHQKPAA